MAELAESTMAEVLAERAPGRPYLIPDLCAPDSWGVHVPAIFIHCPRDDCKGDRWFSGKRNSDSELNQEIWDYRILEYLCKNCGKGPKVFALAAMRAKEGDAGVVIKVGEWPSFGPPTPSQLLSLIGPDRENYLKGRRAEAQGFGIGAYAYYRRVVENQRDRIFDRLIEVVRKVGVSEEVVTDLEKAKGETQFTKSVEVIKHALPDVLKIDGHNPLLALHDALSDGLHKSSDEECLERAGIIRIVLTELGTRTSQILQEKEELRLALAKLASSRQPKAAKTAAKAPQSQRHVTRGGAASPVS